MSEQEASSRFPSAPLRWRVRVCRWLWRVLRFVWGTLIVGIVIGTIVNLNTTPTGTPPSTLFIIHLLLTYPLLVLSGLCLLALLTLLSWLGSRDKQAIPARPLSKQDRVNMLGRLRLRYEQLLKRSLQGAVQLDLRLAQRPAAVQHALGRALHLPDQPEESFPPHTSISEVYKLAEQELLILGGPGAGKSTLVLELAQYLVEQAEQDATQPLPILLPLSSWAERKRPLHEWLGEEIARLYDVPRRLSQQWIQAEQLLPLLDGLDEMEEAARASCITEINAYHREHVMPLVICSRSQEYSAATRHERLALHTAVVVQPLEPRQVDAYLAHLGKPLAELRAALKANSSLQELATTPLLLQILMLTYHDTTVRALSQQEAQVREQVLTDYIQRMVKRKDDDRRYPLDATQTWLGWLAQEMRQHNQTIFSLESLQPDWLPTRRRNLYRWSIGLSVGLVFGLVFGLRAGLTAAVQHYILRFWLARSGVFPWRAVPFLEDATARILLQRVGGGYSFAHRLLLDFFADASTGASSTSPAAQSTRLSSP